VKPLTFSRGISSASIRSATELFIRLVYFNPGDTIPGKRLIYWPHCNVLPLEWSFAVGICFLGYEKRCEKRSVMKRIVRASLFEVNAEMSEK